MQNTENVADVQTDGLINRMKNKMMGGNGGDGGDGDDSSYNEILQDQESRKKKMLLIFGGIIAIAIAILSIDDVSQRNKNTTLTNVVEEQKGTIGLIKDERDGYKGERDELASSVTQLKKVNRDANKQIKKQNGVIVAQRKDILSLQKNNKTLSGRLVKANKIIGEKNKTIDELVGKNGEQNETIVALNSDYERLSVVNQSLQGANNMGSKFRDMTMGNLASLVYVFTADVPDVDFEKLNQLLEPYTRNKLTPSIIEKLHETKTYEEIREYAYKKSLSLPALYSYIIATGITDPKNPNISRLRKSLNTLKDYHLGNILLTIGLNRSEANRLGEILRDTRKL